MMDYECDSCGRDLDVDDARAGICVCGCPIPRKVIEEIEAGTGQVETKAKTPKTNE